MCKSITLLLMALSFVSCATQKALDQYEAKRSNAILVKDEDGCFRVWKHPSDPDRVLVRECEGSEIGQAVTEGIVNGLFFGMVAADHGALGSEFAAAAQKATGRKTLGTSRLNDGFGATGAVEVFLR